MEEKRSQETGPYRITTEERKLLDMIRTVDYGEVRVIVTDGKPTRLEEIRRSIKL